MIRYWPSKALGEAFTTDLRKFIGFKGRFSSYWLENSMMPLKDYAEIHTLLALHYLPSLSILDIFSPFFVR